MSWTLAAQLAAGAVNTVAGIIGSSRALSRANADIKKYQSAIDNFQQPTATNVYSGLKAQTAGEEMATDAMNRTISATLGSAGLSGARGLASVAPKVMDYATDTASKISASYEQKQADIDRLIAEDEKRRQAQDYRFKMTEYAGLHNSLSSAKAAAQGGEDSLIGSVQSGIGLASSALGADATRSMYKKMYGIE
jgi:alcohol dehydrogenase YqhD (iron-dependent ADH family)